MTNLQKLIATCVTYLYLRDVYGTKATAQLQEEDVHNLLEHWLAVEALHDVPDKEHELEGICSRIAGLGKSGAARERELLAGIREESTSFQEAERQHILDAVLTAAQRDHMLTAREKDFLVQLGRALDLPLPQIAGDAARNSGAKGWYAAVVLLLLAIVGVSSYWLVERRWPLSQPRLFATEEVVFQRVFFNRFLVYGNIYEGAPGDHFRRQVILHLNGYADVSFDPKSLSVWGQVARYEPTGAPFELRPVVRREDIVVVDMIDPERVSAEEAVAVGATVGLVGAVAGAGLGAKFAPPGSKLQGAGAGVVVGGTLAGVATGAMLSGEQLVDGINESEKTWVIAEGMKQIRSALSADTELQQRYHSAFEQFVKARLVSAGEPVTQVRVIERAPEEEAR